LVTGRYGNEAKILSVLFRKSLGMENEARLSCLGLFGNYGFDGLPQA